MMMKFETSSDGSLKRAEKSNVRRATWKRASFTIRGDTTETKLVTNDWSCVSLSRAVLDVGEARPPPPRKLSVCESRKL